MNRLNSIFVSIILLGSIIYAPVLSADTNNDIIQVIQEQINSLLEQINELQIQIQGLKGELKVVKGEFKEIISLKRYLRQGMTGDDVKNLQEILATDPGIYPEGLVTGYYGPLTAKAVKKFQKKMNVEQVGHVGPKTLSKINELLKDGNASGKVPPGLLVAPGIKKKIIFTPQPLFGQKLPFGIAKKLDTATSTPPDDIVSPIISDLMATSTTATTTIITWTTNEKTDSSIWYDTSTPLSISSTTPTTSDSSLVKYHSIELFSLTASTTYYCQISSSDEAGNTATSSEYSFTTLP